MTNEQEKLQNALVFESSEVWDAVLYIIDSATKNEIAAAVSQGIDENKRAHQCGRAEALSYIKDLLVDTRELARRNAGRSS